MSATFENLEQAQQSIERGKEERQERQQEAQQAHKDEQAILNAVQEDRVTIRLKGKRMKFSPLMGDEEDFLDDLAAKYGEGGEMDDIDDPDELSGEDLQEFQQAKDRIIDMVTEHNLDAEKYNRDFWEKVPQSLRFEALSKVREGGMETERAGN